MKLDPVVEDLIGQWRLVRTEDPTLDKDVTVDFAANGQLTYTIDIGEKLQIIKLTFRVDGNRIITDQSSQPRIEETRFWFEAPARLVLDHCGKKTWLERK